MALLKVLALLWIGQWVLLVGGLLVLLVIGAVVEAFNRGLGIFGLIGLGLLVWAGVAIYREHQANNRRLNR